MTNFLRSLNNKSHWITYPHIPWLPRGELQGDVLKDIPTTDGALSVYEVNNEADKRRVAIAMAAKRDNVQNFDYAVFDDSELSSLGVELQREEGKTPDREVNRLHFDIKNLTAGKLALLAQVISKGEIKRIPKKDMKQYLHEAVNDGILEEERLNSKLRDSLEIS